MKYVLVILLVWLVIGLKAYWDNKNWGNVDHTKGIFLVALVLIPACIWIHSSFPLFMFGTFWNPVINIVRGLPGF